MSDIRERSLLKSEGIPHAWFKAYIDANKLWPQRNTAVGIMTSAAMLETGASWQQFLSSSFSPEQVAASGKALSVFHKKSNVPVATAEYAEAGDQVVPEARVKQLWDVAKMSGMLTAAMFMEYMYSGRDVSIGYIVESVVTNNGFLPHPDDIKAIHSFFSEPRHGDVRGFLTLRLLLLLEQ